MGAAVPLLLAAAVTQVVAAPAAHAATSGNLIVNGDGAAGLCSNSGYEDMSVPGWTITSGAPNVTCYSNTADDPTASAPGAQPGQGFFTGGTHGNASMTQTADVSAAASAIDAGTATYNLSGWLGGYSSQSDRVAVVATFLNATGGSVGSGQIGPVTAADRNNTTEFLQRTTTGAIPAGTRAIRIDAVFTWGAGGTTDGYAEQLSLTINQSVPTPTLAAPPSTVPGYDHVFLVYMENENYSATSNTADGGAGIIGNSAAPYVNNLAQSNSLLTNYSAVTHNSDPNYVAIAGGSTFGHSAGGTSPTSNCITTCTFNVPSLGDRVDAAGKTWKQYVDGQNGNCDTATHGNYEPDDVPFYYFPTMKNNASYCQAHWQPLSQFMTDLQSASTTPNFVWFAADSCNDMEGCGISAGDTWLSNTLPKIFSSPAWTQQRSLLIVTWDEDGNNLPGGFGNGQTNQVPTIVIGSQNSTKPSFTSNVRYDHYSTGRTIEQALGLGSLTSNDQYATPINDVFQSTAPPPPAPCSGQLLGNPGFESGATTWNSTSGVIGQWASSGEPPHSGTWNAWLDGYGSAHTDTVSQSVTIPAGCHATLSFWLHVDTAETGNTANDTLTVQAGSSTVASYSNLDASSGYVQKSVDLSQFAGQTVPVTFTGTENASAQTSFVLDDAAVTVS